MLVSVFVFKNSEKGILVLFLLLHYEWMRDVMLKKKKTDLQREEMAVLLVRCMWGLGAGVYPSF